MTASKLGEQFLRLVEVTIAGLFLLAVFIVIPGVQGSSADSYYVFEGMASSSYMLRVNFREERIIELTGTTQLDIEL